MHTCHTHTHTHTLPPPLATGSFFQLVEETQGGEGASEVVACKFHVQAKKRNDPARTFLVACEGSAFDCCGWDKVLAIFALDQGRERSRGRDGEEEEQQKRSKFPATWECQLCKCVNRWRETSCDQCGQNRLPEQADLESKEEKAPEKEEEEEEEELGQSIPDSLLAILAQGDLAGTCPRVNTIRLDSTTAFLGLTSWKQTLCFLTACLGEASLHTYDLGLGASAAKIEITWADTQPLSREVEEKGFTNLLCSPLGEPQHYYPLPSFARVAFKAVGIQGLSLLKIIQPAGELK